MTTRPEPPLGGPMRPDPASLPRWGARAFQGFGALLAVGGLVLVFDDPAGFAMLGAGLLFLGIGTLVGRLFTPAPGTRSVRLEGDAGTVVGTDGRALHRRSGRVLAVPEEAGPAAVEAVRREALREQWQARPDWVAGRVLAEDQRTGHRLKGALVAWSVFTALALAAALRWGDLAWLVAGVGGILTAGLAVETVRRGLRLRRFAPSVLVLAERPIPLGGVLEGEVDTGVPGTLAVADGFVLELECFRRWEEQAPGGDRSAPTRLHRDSLYLVKERVPGFADDPGGSWHVPVRFPVPADRPPATLDAAVEGVCWELRIRASLPGIDFEADFRLPVLDPALAWLGQVPQDAGSSG